VGSCRPAADLGAAKLQHDDRLTTLRGQLCELNELGDVLQPFNEAGDHSGIGIVQQVAPDVGELQVGFVAG